MLAYVVYETVGVYTVDLDSEQVIALDLYPSTMEHVDTGLSEESPRNWQELHARARQLVEVDPRRVAPRWKREE